MFTTMFEPRETRSFIQSSAWKTSDGMSESEDFGNFFDLKGGFTQIATGLLLVVVGFSQASDAIKPCR